MNIRLRWIASRGLLGLCMISLMIGCRVRGTEETVAECEHLIGAVFPLTGDLAGFGETSRQGLELAFKDGVKAKDGCGLRLQIEDGRGDTTASINAYSRLKAAGAKAIVTNVSHVALALSERARNDRILLFADAAHPALTPAVGEVQGVPLVFRHSSVVTQEGKILVEAIGAVSKGKSAPRVAVAVLNNDYGVSVLDSLRDEVAKAKSAQVVSEVRFDPTETEFLAVTRYLLERSPDSVVLVGYSRSLGLLINFLRDSGFKGEIICSVGLTVTRDAINVAKENVEEVVFNAFYLRSGDRAYKTLRDRYQQAYASEPPENAVLMYNTGLLVKHAYENAERLDPESIAAFVVGLGEFIGAGEKMSIHKNGDVLPELAPARYFSSGIVWLRQE